MRKEFLGECAITIGKGGYFLRPSFHALYSIEQHCGQNISTIIDTASQQPLSAKTIECIVTEGLRAYYGELPPLPMMRPNDWRKLHDVAAHFLIHGLGYYTQNDDPTPARDAKPTATPFISSSSPKLFEPPKLPPIHWRELYQIATSALGCNEKEFWEMTMCGFLLRCEAHMNLWSDSEIAASGIPATPDELCALMERFPDVATTAAS